MNMEKISKWILGIIFIACFLSCSSYIELEEMFDFKSPFIITLTNENPLNSQATFEIDTLKIGSEKYKKLIKFLKNNSENWKKFPVSYIGDISIRQGKMNLTRIKNGLVLNFTNEKNESNQFIKTINSSELDFLKK